MTPDAYVVFDLAASATVAITLAASGGYHLIHLSMFRDDIVDQGVVPPRLAGIVGGTVSAIELSLAAGAPMSAVLAPAIHPALLGLAAVFLLGLAGYSAAVVKTTPDASCACGPMDERVGRSTWVRALALALIAAVGALISTGLAGSQPILGAVGLAAGTAFALLIWILPSAVTDAEAMHLRGAD